MIQITRKIDYKYIWRKKKILCENSSNNCYTFNNTLSSVIKDDDTICSSRDDSILKEYDDNWVEKKQVDKNYFTKIVEINLPQ